MQTKNFRKSILLSASYEQNTMLQHKEETMDPAQSIDEVWNVSCTAMSGIEMQYIENGLEN